MERPEVTGFEVTGPEVHRSGGRRAGGPEVTGFEGNGPSVKGRIVKDAGG